MNSEDDIDETHPLRSQGLLDSFGGHEIGADEANGAALAQVHLIATLPRQDAMLRQRVHRPQVPSYVDNIYWTDRVAGLFIAYRLLTRQPTGACASTQLHCNDHDSRLVKCPFFYENTLTSG